MANLFEKIDWLSIIIAVIICVIYYNYMQYGKESFSLDNSNDTITIGNVMIKGDTDTVPWSIRQENGHLIFRRSGGPYSGWPKLINPKSKQTSATDNTMIDDDDDHRWFLNGTGQIIGSGN